MADAPKNLLDAVKYFSDVDVCIQYLAEKRWPTGVVTCPTCASDRVSYLSNQKRWQCSVRHPKRQFSIKVGTIMEDSPLGLDKWLPAMWLIASNRNGISSWELHRALQITQKSAWFMLHRIRLAMQDEETGGQLGGEGKIVEIDETYIGGKARNMHADRKHRVQMDGRNAGRKAIVIAALERKGKVKAKVSSDRKKKTMQPFVRVPFRLALTFIATNMQTRGAWMRATATES